MKKLFSILLVLVMIFSVTALAAEPEHICAGKCDHEHDEDSTYRWECSNHILVPFAKTEYLQYDGTYHYYRAISGDICANENCDYTWITVNTGWTAEEHEFAGGIGECLKCLYWKGR